MIRIERLEYHVLRVADLERPKRFYVDLLGMHVLEQDPNHGGVFLGLGGDGNTLDLLQSTDPASSGPYRFQVHDPGRRHGFSPRCICRKDSRDATGGQVYASGQWRSTRCGGSRPRESAKHLFQ